jgi:ABC-2 type transport system ATP-binding protein
MRTPAADTGRKEDGRWGATHVSVSFGDTLALNDVTVRAVPGEVTAVVGGDGAGKSTLLRCLAGALAPDTGTVAGPGPAATGYFPASSGTYPDLTVAENLAFRATAYNARGPAAAQRAAELMDRAGLTAARDRLAGHLSGGMRQKLGVIAALLPGPDLLILDEPGTGVDPVSRSGLWLLIATAAADGAAVVLSTTYIDDAQRAGQVLVLDAGRELAAGTPDQIVADMPGSVFAVPTAPARAAAPVAWRRGGGWRVWEQPGGPADARAAGDRVTADLQDAVTVAALAREHAQAREPGPAAEAGEDGPAGEVSPPSPRRPASPRRPTGPRRPASPARPAGPLVECLAVTCKFAQFTAVNDVTLRIRAGEIVGLLGANGAGKTTLIRMLLGLQRPTAGHIALFGEPPSRQTRRRIGYVPQGLGLYDDLTAAENAAFAAAVFGGGPATLPGDFAGVTGVAPRSGKARHTCVPVGQLPLGLQRRAAFAQALAHQPDLLVLDEPTSGVDPLGRARLWDTIARATRAGAGVLVSTHYMEEAGECDRLVIMSAGAVVATGTVDEIVGDSQVTVVETDAWASSFRRLSAAGLPAALAGRSLRVPSAPVAQVREILADDAARVFRAPATLEERFFELAETNEARLVPA